MEQKVISKGIKSWPKTERPRERLLKSGVDSLSDAELVAILLRTGIRDKDATQLARELLSHFGGLRGLMAVGIGDLSKVKGLGQAKIATLLAATEIAKRKLKEEIIGKNLIKDPQSVLAYLYTSLRDKKREVFKILFLNKANRVIDEQNLFEGTIDEASIHPREVVKSAIERHATNLVLIHNHPSGEVQPSIEDEEITKKVQSACSAVSIKILDHIIVGDNQYFSFKEHNLLA